MKNECNIWKITTLLYGGYILYIILFGFYSTGEFLNDIFLVLSILSICATALIELIIDFLWGVFHG